jgi:hypothetical protein
MAIFYYEVYISEYIICTIRILINCFCGKAPIGFYYKRLKGVGVGVVACTINVVGR